MNTSLNNSSNYINIAVYHYSTTKSHRLGDYDSMNRKSNFGSNLLKNESTFRWWTQIINWLPSSPGSVLVHPVLFLFQCLWWTRFPDYAGWALGSGEGAQWFEALAALVVEGADSISSTQDGSEPTTVPEDPTHSTDLYGHQACGAHTHIHIHTCRQNITPIT